MAFEVRMYHGYNNNTVYGTFPGYISVMVHYLVRMRVTSQITSRMVLRNLTPPAVAESYPPVSAEIHYGR